MRKTWYCLPHRYSEHSGRFLTTLTSPDYLVQVVRQGHGGTAGEKNITTEITEITENEIVLI